MNTALVVVLLLPTLVKCSGEGNIHLLEEEVAAAIKACVMTTEIPKDNNNANQRQRRSDEYPRIDNDTTRQNQYSHERRNGTEIKDEMLVLNATDYDYGGYGSGNGGEKFSASVPRSSAAKTNNTDVNLNRTRRSEPLLNKPDVDQCLSQCIFANLQVVDAKGIPRETELWNKVQSAVTSQQSRTALKDQIRACFQELQSEAEDNGCSYSNKLERCLMLRFSDRKTPSEVQETTQKN